MPTLVELLRSELLTARRSGDRAVAATMRTALAALANAEAVRVDGAVPAVATEHVAGLRSGATEAERRSVPHREQVALVRAELTDFARAAATYDGVDPARAEDARAGARALGRVLAEAGG